MTFLRVIMVKHAAKIVVLGDGAVGKTSLVRRYVKGRFDKNYIATIGVNVQNIVLNDLDIHLNIWDIYGQKSIYPGKHSSNYIGAEGAIIVFDITRSITFVHVNEWIKQLYETTGRIPVFVLGNKYDILKDFEKKGNITYTERTQKEFHEYMLSENYYRNVLSEEKTFTPVPYSAFYKWANKKNPFGHKIPHLISSAKTGANVNRAFNTLAKQIVYNKIKY